ncbi:DUF2484 family protein [Tropicimonas sp. S265A]|uniref:DUF2484 family protein n=1 Tax=Tropicimonas sp. S265A TaxID=3415134 RepID=UPI003C7B6E0C
MPLSLALACLWFVVAVGIALIPSKKHHWPQAYVLIAIGLPLLLWVFAENGPWVGLAVLVGAISILRWPVIYLFRWVHRKALGRQA